jgi:hypothetical protein
MKNIEKVSLRKLKPFFKRHIYLIIFVPILILYLSIIEDLAFKGTGIFILFCSFAYIYIIKLKYEKYESKIRKLNSIKSNFIEEIENLLRRMFIIYVKSVININQEITEEADEFIKNLDLVKPEEFNEVIVKFSEKLITLFQEDKIDNKNDEIPKFVKSMFEEVRNRRNLKLKNLFEAVEKIKYDLCNISFEAERITFRSRIIIFPEEVIFKLINLEEESIDQCTFIYKNLNVAIIRLISLFQGDQLTIDTVQDILYELICKIINFIEQQAEEAELEIRDYLK